jgi:hypothetical protein
MSISGTVVKKFQVAISALEGKLPLDECQRTGQTDPLATGLRHREQDYCQHFKKYRGICITTDKNHGNPQLG